MFKMFKKDKNYSFSKVSPPNLPHSTFNRSKNHITAFNSGMLVPVYCDEILPGDVVDLNLKAFSRLSTPVCPIMDNIRIDYHFFFVPSRLLWTHWKAMMGEQKNPGVKLII